MTSASDLEPISARAAYRLWAPEYDRETVISALDDRAVSELSPRARGRALLDAGCGTGRRLRSVAGVASRAVGVDLVPEMLLAGRRSGAIDAPLLAADVGALPLRQDTFDLVWCRLVIGHVADPGTLYAELGRVSRDGGRLIVTDFHPAAAAAGHLRSFRDAAGRIHRVVHHAHTEADHRRAAGMAGWRVSQVHHLAPGPRERRFYEEAGRVDSYEEHRRLPLVLAICLDR